MTHLLAVQHRLPSVRWLLEQINRHGISGRCTLVSKPYSAIEFPICVEGVKERPTVHDALTGELSEILLALDEGGLIHASVPDNLVARTTGVEQTSFGYRSRWNYPTVLVCRSAAKLLFESQIIARGILRKLDCLGVLKSKRVGVVGLGALGAELARALIGRGVGIVGAEISAIPTDLRTIAVSLSELIGKCDVILGCTGTDALAGFDWTSCAGDRLLISCSSSDIEFRSLLKRGTRGDTYGTINGQIEDVRFAVLNGGYPINFDRLREWEHFEEIVLTRQLVLAGLQQAKALLGQSPRGIMLNPQSQMHIVNEWLSQVPERHELTVPRTLDESFFRIHSEGELLMGDKPYTLHHTTPGALANMRQHTFPYTKGVMGFQIVILPNVWSPAYDWSSLFHLENLPDVIGLDFLEVGCGTGIISVGAARNGARKVVAVDVNPDAVRNTQMNFARHNIRNAEVFVSDVFADVTGLFDIVAWNAPYHGTRPADMLERGCADEDYRDVRAFFRNVGNHLKPGGLVIFGFSESGDMDLLEELIAENGFRVRRKLSDWRDNYNCMLFELTRSQISSPMSKPNGIGN